MEPDVDLDPNTDDLPLRANTNHILVKHFVLDLTVQLHRKVIGGTIVLFLEPGLGGQSKHKVGDQKTSRAEVNAPTEAAVCDDTGDGAGVSAAGSEATTTRCMVGTGESSLGFDAAERAAGEDFTVVLDCRDLSISKVEEVDVTSLPSMSSLLEEVRGEEADGKRFISRSAALLQKLTSIPSNQWREQHRLFSECSCAPAAHGGGSLEFHTDLWSLQVRKRGVGTPEKFPRVLRISYETRPEGGSVRWTKDQDGRVCVYTAGSPINNRALFPCQEPPVAMSTWQARVRAPSECVVLMSGENQVIPVKDEEKALLIWDYYVTMTMPASTFTLAVGHWSEAIAELPAAAAKGVMGSIKCGELAKTGAGPSAGTEVGPVSRPGSSTSPVMKTSSLQSGSQDPTASSNSSSSYPCLEVEEDTATHYSDPADHCISCSHGDYPCRFTERSAWSQRVVPHRVFAPISLLPKAQAEVLSLLPRCLAAAHATLGVHPFPRLDVLIVPAGFSSLGMASPHIVFLSQSVLSRTGPGGGELARSLCGSRLCHELAHSWFGLAIGARDWTEEWISEGFATYLEDVIWARAQQLDPEEVVEQSNLKASLRWRRLSDELQNSEEELQILRPNMEKTGEVSECGSSVVKHALNPDKTFMQVHYLKGYFLLTFLANEVGEPQFIHFFRLFVKKFHGQLILSQDFLRMLLTTFPDVARNGLTLAAIYADWMDRPGIPKWLYERSAVWSQARLVKEVKAEVIKWILLSRSKGKGRKRKRAEPKVNYKELRSDQLVLLLELLLEEAETSVATLRALQRAYTLQKQDAEVRHRWCELVVKTRFSQAYDDVEHFLVNDQAMGVYLYGELMVHEDPGQQALARRCLSLVREGMDRSARTVVEEMVL